MNDDNVSFDDEHDEYDDLLAEIGRTKCEDERIAIHEAGHAVAARLLGKPLGGATINPDQNGKYGGLVWGPRHSVAFGSDDDGDDVPELCDSLRDLMPQDGEARGGCILARARPLHRTGCGVCRRAHASARRARALC
ncbi:hypothetical protein ACVI1J_002292 [Bradyrhizobium diazoefficiens]